VVIVVAMFTTLKVTAVPAVDQKKLSEELDDYCERCPVNTYVKDGYDMGYDSFVVNEHFGIPTEWPRDDPEKMSLLWNRALRIHHNTVISSLPTDLMVAVSEVLVRNQCCCVVCGSTDFAAMIYCSFSKEAHKDELRHPHCVRCSLQIVKSGTDGGLVFKCRSKHAEAFAAVNITPGKESLPKLEHILLWVFGSYMSPTGKFCRWSQHLNKRPLCCTNVMPPANISAEDPITDKIYDIDKAAKCAHQLMFQV